MTTFDREMADICYQRIIWMTLGLISTLFREFATRQKANLMRLTSQTATNKKLQKCMFLCIIQKNQFCLTWFKVNYTLESIGLISYNIRLYGFLSSIRQVYNLMECLSWNNKISNLPKIAFVIENTASSIPKAISEQL